MNHYFAYVNENDELGVGGSYILHASSVLDLARKLADRVTIHIDEQPFLADDQIPALES